MASKNITKKKMVVFKQPRITEKATMLSGFGVYTFEVPKSATKNEVMKAVETLYKVKPLKIRMITIPSKNVFKRGKAGIKSGGKKALVYMKKGETIEFV